ncbi:MAG: glycerol kinase GlpK [Planctomycetes bacterium]|nr:glycerol kinase GlpK [Planctomycetota bacterium]
MGSAYILAIDQGTTSTRAAIFNELGQGIASVGREFRQHYPKPGWVEHDPLGIWQTVAEVVPEALAQARIAPQELAGIGLTNQRETVVLWDRATSQPVAPGIVWQDRRTAAFCKEHHADEPWLFERTGLVLDPYFSATKIRWLLENDPTIQSRAKSGHLAVGTIDSWLLWNLTGGAVHATDYSNASRTLLMNLHTARWDTELCRYFDVPEAILPDAKPSVSRFGVTAALPFLPAGIPICGIAGDQQAALFGQGGFRTGEGKCTYGTGAFFLLNTGVKPIRSQHRLLSSLAAMTDTTPQYVLEGSVFVAGAAIQWLRDGLHLLARASDSEALATRSSPEEPTLFVPGLVGLGAPHWIPEARGVLFGLTRKTSPADLARAALEGVALQVVDLIAAADLDTGVPLDGLRVDGGMSRNAWFLQCQADLLGLPVLPALEKEATALGAAFLAGLQVGVWPDLDAIRKMTLSSQRFEPTWNQEQRERKLRNWRRAVAATIAYYRDEA